MATPLKPVLLTSLLLLMVLMVEDKPALAKGGKGLRERKKVLENAVRELDEEINKRETLERSRGKYTYNWSAKCHISLVVWATVELLPSTLLFDNFFSKTLCNKNQKF